MATMGKQEKETKKFSELTFKGKVACIITKIIFTPIAVICMIPMLLKTAFLKIRMGL